MANEIGAYKKSLCVYVDDTLMQGMLGTDLLLETSLADRWDVVHVVDAREGMNIALSGLYETRQVAMMILDYHMPNHTGAEIAQARRNLEKENNLSPMPLYLHSTANDELTKFQDLFNGTIPKPMTAKIAEDFAAKV